ncbi:hypothetical protein TWF506_001935 [Arthrobotrys conoides]|uniref:Uncharacterized protein n=1 Tax=Arthrobotrys conoides TaxID=74498 RepID=A0AAN8RRP2_9PEZI
MKLQLASIFGLLALSEAAVLDRRQNSCSYNNCLRALIRRTELGVNVAGECAIYAPGSGVVATTIVVTATVTATEVVAVVETATDTATSTDTATDTDTSTETSTETQLFTQTDSQTSRATAFDTATFTSDVTVVGTTVATTPTITIALPTVMIAKRQASLITFSDVPASPAPTYASACSAWAKYSSACSCLTSVVSPITTAVPATFTSSDISTFTEISSSTTLSTTTSTFITTTTTTTTVTATITGTISTTDTISPTVTTVTDLVTDASTTIINPVTTVTSTTDAPAVTWVAVKIVGREDDANKAGQYLRVGPSVSEGVSRVNWTSSEAEAENFYWNPDTKQIKIDTTDGPRFICTQLVENDALFVHIMSEALCTTYFAPKLRFTLDIGNHYTLDNTRFKKFGYRTDSDHFIIAKDSINWSQYQANEVFLKAVNGLEEEVPE